jgi:CRISPR-associated endonuclease/helicase Cas3
VPPSEPPPGILRQSRDVTRSLLAVEPAAPLLAPARFERFFQSLYWVQGDRLDRYHILQDLLAPTPGLCFDFATASRLFRIIPDDELPVVVPFGKSPELIAEIERYGPDRLRLRRLQRFTVGVPRRQHSDLVTAGVVRELPDAPGIFVLSRPELYHSAVGLTPQPNVARPAEPRT